jgi:hypothetical protein
MLSFKAVAIFLSTLAVAAAVPVNKGACSPNAFEHFNLAHHHDINTGKIIVGKKITTTPIKIGGSGCSPIWAGGSYDDSAHFSGKKYPAWLSQGPTAE